MAVNDAASSFTPLSFAAGSIAGAIGQLIGHPLDTLKVFAQTNARPEALSLRVLYRGAAMPIATSGAVQALNLGIFENARRWISRARPDAGPLLRDGLAGSIAGLSISAFTCPLSRIKVLQQTAGTSTLATVRAAAASGTLYAGFGPTVAFEASRGLYMASYTWLKHALHTSAHDGARNGAHDDGARHPHTWLKHAFVSAGGSGAVAGSREAALHASAHDGSGAVAGSREAALHASAHDGSSAVAGSREADGSLVPLWVRTCAGAGANLICWGVMYPVDLVRCTLQAVPAMAPVTALTTAPATALTTAPATAMPESGRRVVEDALECAHRLHAEGGVLRFYRGFWPTMLRAGPVAGAIMPTFELTLAWLERHR
jgi:hypothetical protein